MGNRPKILYVDDEPLNLKTFHAAFHEDFEIITAESGEQGLVLFREHLHAGLAVVVSDQRMPGMNGVDFLVKLLHEDPVPIRIILTAYADFHNVREAVNKGQIYQFVQKPWDYRTFKPLLERAVEIYSMARQNQQLIKDLEHTNQKLQSANQRLEQELYSRQHAEKKRRDAEVMMLAQAKLASLGEMSTGLAHEINQPLSFINVILQSADREIASGKFQVDEFQDDVQESLRQVQRITKIIDHLRTFGRKDSGVFSPVSLEKIINDTLIPLKQRLKIANIILTLKLEPNLPDINGSSNKIEQILINLIINAIDALEESAAPTMTIRLHQDDQNHIITLSDNGPGICEEHRNKIFEPFFTTKEVGKGTGVGLAIVYGIVQEHKGTITCASEVGRGTTFTITFPKIKKV